MPLLRPLDPAFPIDRQLAVDATPVVLVNLVTLEPLKEVRDGECDGIPLILLAFP
jgi:hypothetical protein